MKIFFDDYHKLKEETIKEKKDRTKNGIFKSVFIKIKKMKKKKNCLYKFPLPKLNTKENPCFYIDFFF